MNSGLRLAHRCIMRVLGKASRMCRYAPHSPDLSLRLSVGDKSPTEISLCNGGQPPSQFQIAATTIKDRHPIRNRKSTRQSLSCRENPREESKSAEVGWTSAVDLLAVYRLEVSEKEIHSRALRVSSDERHCVPCPARRSTFDRSPRIFIRQP